MDIIDLLKLDRPRTSMVNDNALKMQTKARRLCHRFNNADPDDEKTKDSILKELFGTWQPQLIIEPDFRCDYGFNIHFHGFALINYNCVILDTAPVHIGKNVFIAPGVCIACAGHAIDPKQRADGIETAAPITIGDDVWIGANSTILGGATIGNGSVIGAGSVVTKDIPSGVIAVGAPARVLRNITEKDKISLNNIL